MDIYIALPYIFGLVVFSLFLAVVLVIFGEVPKNTKKKVVRAMISGSVGLIFAGLFTVVANWYMIAVPVYRNQTCLEFIMTTSALIPYNEYLDLLFTYFIGVMDSMIIVFVTFVIGAVLFYSISLYRGDVHEN